MSLILAKGAWAVKAATSLGQRLLDRGYVLLGTGVAVPGTEGYLDNVPTKVWSANRWGPFGSGGGDGGSGGGSGGGGQGNTKPLTDDGTPDGVPLNVSALRQQNYGASGGITGHPQAGKFFSKKDLDGSESGSMYGGHYVPSNSERKYYRNGGFEAKDPAKMTRAESAQHVAKLEASRSEAIGKGLSSGHPLHTAFIDKEIDRHAYAKLATDEYFLTRASSKVSGEDWSPIVGKPGALAEQMARPAGIIPDSVLNSVPDSFDFGSIKAATPAGADAARSAAGRAFTAAMQWRRSAFSEIAGRKPGTREEADSLAGTITSRLTPETGLSSTVTFDPAASAVVILTEDDQGRPQDAVRLAVEQS